MARAEADMGVTPAGSPTPEPPYAVPPLGSAAAGDDEDEEASMLHGRVSHPPRSAPHLHPSLSFLFVDMLFCVAMTLSLQRLSTRQPKVKDVGLSS